MGSDTTKSAVQNVFWTPVKRNVALLKAARANKTDCALVPVTLGGNAISRLFGSACTANGLKFQFNDRFRPLAKRQLALLDSGLDPKDVDLNGNRTNGHHNSRRAPANIIEEISRMFGNDSTAGGIGFQFRSIKHAAQARRDWVEAGNDAQHLPAGVIATMLNDGTTKYSLEHKFRPIKKMAQEMKAAAGGSSAPSSAVKTPSSRKRAPAKKSSKKATVSDEEDDDELSLGESPSKGKGSINRVKTGRVTKPARATKANINYAESGDEDEMAHDSQPIKSEPGFAVQASKNGYNGFPSSESYGESYEERGFGNNRNQGEEVEDFFGAVEEFEDA